MKKIYFVLAGVVVLGMLFFFFYINKKVSVSKNIKIGERIIESDFIIYKPDLEKSEIKMYWKSDDGNAYKDINSFEGIYKIRFFLNTYISSQFSC